MMKKGGVDGIIAPQAAKAAYDGGRTEKVRMVPDDRE